MSPADRWQSSNPDSTRYGQHGRTQAKHGGKVELVIAGDFNRHDQLWGGDHVVEDSRQGEAGAIITLMQDLELNGYAISGDHRVEIIGWRSSGGGSSGSTGSSVMQDPAGCRIW
jgi:hypothetical protein